MRKRLVLLAACCLAAALAGCSDTRYKCCRGCDKGCCATGRCAVCTCPDECKGACPDECKCPCR